MLSNMMWRHYCPAEHCVLSVEESEQCNWCGARAPGQDCTAELKGEHRDERELVTCEELES